jgi:hypothetical protein
MRHGLRVTMAVVLTAAVAAPMTAAEDVADGARREDAPRQLEQALRAGTADAAALAAIADWILSEKEEKVAARLADVLGAFGPGATSASGERWDETARAIFPVFAAVLRHAAHDRRGGDAFDSEISAAMSAAAPAVAAALRDADPAARASILAVLGGLGPAGGDLVPLLVKAFRHEQPEVRMAAAAALGALGPSARAAIPALRSAADDPAAGVRDAAGEALRRIDR